MFLAPSSSRASRSLAYNHTAKGVPEQAWQLNTDTAYSAECCALAASLSWLLLLGMDDSFGGFVPAVAWRLFTVFLASLP